MLADRLPRPKLLAACAFAWSALTLAASRATSFGDLMGSRLALAMAQSSQNTVAFDISEPQIGREGGSRAGVSQSGTQREASPQPCATL